MDETQTPWIERLPWYTTPALLLGVPLLAMLIAQIWPAFYADVIWQYYWGPIVSDASGQALCSSGDPPGFSGCGPGESLAEPGYNIINTLSWAGLLGICLVGIWQMLRYFKAQMDDKLILGATAWVVVGSIWHVLEDSGLMAPPLQYFFITPPIYLLFGAFGIVSFAYAQYIKRVVEKTGSLEQGLQKIWFLFAGIVLLYTLLWVREWDQVIIYVNPVWVALFAIITFAVVRYRAMKAAAIDPSEMVMTFSIGWFLLAFAYVWSYLQAPWGTDVRESEIPWTFVIAPVLAAATAGAVYLVARSLQKKGNKSAFAFLMPINLILVFSQALDGFATALGIDLTARYSEKHILSEFIRRSTERIGSVFADYPTFLGFVPVKIIISLLVIYAIDVSGKDDENRSENMIGLIKFAIIMVGIGPGVRNMTRMSLGI